MTGPGTRPTPAILGEDARQAPSRVAKLGQKMKNVTLKALGISEIIDERSDLHIRVSTRCRTLQEKSQAPLPSGALPSEEILMEIRLLRESNSQVLSKLTKLDRQSKSFLTREAHVIRDLEILKGLDEELERLEDVWFQLSLRVQVEEITKTTHLRDHAIIAMKQELDKLRHHQTDISTLRRIVVVQECEFQGTSISGYCTWSSTAYHSRDLHSLLSRMGDQIKVLHRLAKGQQTISVAKSDARAAEYPRYGAADDGSLLK